MSELNELLERYVRDGNVSAMDEIVARTRARLLGTARRIGDPQDAEDTVQATYYALLRRGEKPLEAPLIAWLLTVTVRIAYRRKAARRREVVLADQLSLPSDEPGPEQTAARAERHVRLREEVTRLPPTYRDVIVLRYLEGLSSKECARLLDTTEPNVRTRLKRARDLLRGRLPPRVAYGLFLVPWWIADAATAASSTALLLGAAMKPKTVVVAALLAVLGLLSIARYGIRGESDQPVARAERAATPESERSSETVDDGLSIPEPLDLAAVDRDRDIHGTVVTSAGVPIAGARIGVIELPWRRATVLNVTDHAISVAGPATQSARDGTFSIRWVPGRLGWLDVTADGFAARRIPQVQAGECLRIVLDAGARVVVQVAGGDGSPVEGARVRIFPRAQSAMHSREHRGETGSDGRCVLDGVAGPTRAYVDVSHPLLARPTWTAIEVPAGGEQLTVDVALAPARTLSGRVTEAETGRPIEGATIGFGWTQQSPVLSGMDGTYSLPGWTGKGEIAISHPEYGSEQAGVGGQRTIDFALERGARVTGRIVDEDCRPVADARVAAIGKANRRLSRGYAVSDADGTFTVGGLRHDMFHALVVMRQGYGRYLLDLPLAARPGDLLRVGDIRLCAGRTIAGRVVQGAGKPLPRLRVSLKGANADRGRLKPAQKNQNSFYGESEERYTDDLGRFRFPDLSPGTYQVTATTAGGTIREVELTMGPDQPEASAELQFAESRALFVKVQTEDGVALPNAMVEAQFGDGDTAKGRTNEGGSVALQVHGALARVAVLFATGERSGPRLAFPALAVDPAPDATDATIVVYRFAFIDGVVLKPDGSPMPFALLRVLHDGRHYRDVNVQQDGEFSIVVPKHGQFDLMYAGRLNQERRGYVHESYVGAARGIAPNSENVEVKLTALDTAVK